MVWIGLVTVEQRPGAGVLMDRNKAFVQVLAMASDEQEYRSSATAACDAIGFDVLEIEDVDPLEERLRSYTVAEELLQKAEAVRLTGYARFGTFVTWTIDD